jgi:hypothetical protein
MNRPPYHLTYMYVCTSREIYVEREQMIISDLTMQDNNQVKVYVVLDLV